MTVNRALALVVAVMCAFALYLWWPDDEHAIRVRLAEAAAALSVPSPEPDVARLTRIAGLRPYLATDIHVSNGGEGIDSRNAVLALVGRWPAPPGGMRVEFADLDIALSADATAEIRLTVQSTTRVDGRTEVDARDADVRMAKRDGAWVITRAETKEAVR